jgi:hypothetical protein
LELPEADLCDLFNQNKITGYTVIQNKTKDGIPQTFTVLSQQEAEALNVNEAVLKPVYYEFVYVRQPR